MESLECNSSSTPTGSPSPIESPICSPMDSPIDVEDELEASEANIHNVSDFTVGNKRLKSEVWKHFKKIKVDGNDKAECNYCHKRLGGKASDGTTHLRHHNSICKFRPNRSIRQQTLLQQQMKADGKMSIANYTFDQEASRKSLARMIAMHEYPISMVEHHGFKEYSASLQPLFKVPSRNTIRSDIMKIYEASKSKMMDLLEKNSSRVAITTDMWTASNQKKGYMVVTAHFIDNNWDLQNLILRFFYVPAPHTTIALSTELVNCLFDWNLDRKLSTLTVDNCTTNDAIIDHLLNKLSPNHLILDGKLLHMRCFAHILNLIVQEGLKIIGDGIERIRDSVAFWLATPKREQTFRENARHLHIDCSKKLILDCKTRWNSTFLMLNVALIYKDVFERLLQREALYNIKVTKEDWVLASKICEKLKVFYNASNAFSGRKYPTSNVFFPFMCEIKLSLISWSSSSDQTIRNMAKCMIQKFDKYWETVHGIIAVATILDPRFKLKLLQYFFPQIYGEFYNCHIERIKRICYDLLATYQLSSRPNKLLHGAGNSGYVSGVGILEYSTNALEGFDSFVNASDDSVDKSELDLYLDEKVLPRNAEDFDILVWWKSVGLRFPTLQKIAKDILAVPISTVASESAFSTGGRVVGPHRNRLHATTLEALMCTQNWILNDLEGSCLKGNDAIRATIFSDVEPDEDFQT